MHTDSAFLTYLERLQDIIDDGVSTLAEKYDVRLTTPYPGENFGDVRRAIQASKPTPTLVPDPLPPEVEAYCAWLESLGYPGA